MPIKKPRKRSGTQTIERAIGLLREVSASGHVGSQLSDLAAHTGLRKSTAHRILLCLVRERLIKQRPGDRLYMPGPMLFELGLSSLPERGELQHAARSRLAALATRTQSVAYLFFRSGDDFVCATRIGTARLEAKALTIFPGTRRPLVLAAGGAAVLLAIPEAEARSTIRRNLASLSREGERHVTVRAIRNMLQRSYDAGFGVNAGDLLAGVNSFGLALSDAAGVPFAAIELAGPARTLPLERLTEIRRLLETTAAGLQAVIV